MKIYLAIVAFTLALCACGPKTETAPAAKPATPVPTGPELAGVGTLAGLRGKTVTLDHEAVTGGLPAGRHEFRAYADVLAEAPLEPGTRVSFRYQAFSPLPVLTDLKRR